ncbi:MAG: bacillithiol biosynthesis protein BshC, partial [Gemmatimonadales bacterium]
TGLVQDGEGFVARRSGERFRLAELERVAAEAPGRLSPNVLLRPVVESALLPTVAYLAGPAELRYLRLASPIYHRLQVMPQLPMARWSGLLVEPRVDRVLEKFGASLEELMQPENALESRVIRAQLPQEVSDTLGGLRQAIEEAYGVVQGAAVQVDPTLEKPVQNVKHQALAGTQEIEKRLLQHFRKRQETEVQQIARARAAVLPLGKPQERILTLAPFLARHGPGLLGELLAAMSDWYRGGLEDPRVPS